MARQNISVGTNANDATGDTLRVAFGKVNNNFIELYSSGGVQGTTGVQGVQGASGSSGSAGSQGVQGLQGVQGVSIQGIQGTTGSAGSAGSQGVQGIQGISGGGLPLANGTSNIDILAANGYVTVTANTFIWTFDETNGSLDLPGNVTNFEACSSINFVPNSSGDGYGYSTIELRPDSNAVNDQYLIIDPTVVNHIHIRAGGAQDNSAGQLYIGGENSHLLIGSGENPSVFIAANGSTWTFDKDSRNLYVPGAVNFQQNATIPLGPPAINGANDRVILWDFQGTGSGYNYAIGAEGNHMWFSMDVNNGTGGFKYYSRNNEIMKIQDDGVLKLTNNIAWSNSNTVMYSVANGNGEGYSVLNIIPDVDKYPTDQYVIIDPGVTPAHVHLRAGGSMDDSSAILSLGGDASYFRINSGPNPEAYVASNNKIWTFGQDGTMQFPVITYANLPLATTAGIRSFISDSSLDATSWGAVTSGGGANTVPVFSDGTDWRIG